MARAESLERFPSGFRKFRVPEQNDCPFKKKVRKTCVVGEVFIEPSQVRQPTFVVMQLNEVLYWNISTSPAVVVAAKLLPFSSKRTSDPYYFAAQLLFLFWCHKCALNA